MLDSRTLAKWYELAANDPIVKDLADIHPFGCEIRPVSDPSNISTLAVARDWNMESSPDTDEPYGDEAFIVDVWATAIH